MFLIRADANPSLGSGHVMRCLSIAIELRKLGQDITFITADHIAEQIITRNNFPLICLKSVWNSLEEELQKIKQLISDMNIQAILIDSYYITQKYLKELKELAKVIVMDDLNLFEYPADMIINYNIYAKKFSYLKGYPEGTEFLLGCDYVPLRDEFIGKKKYCSDQVKNVLVTTGGADAFNIAGQLILSIRARKELENLTLHILVGPLNMNIELLKGMSKDYPRVVLHQNVTAMSELMLQCDIAISAGGSTLYELCACGIPTISFSYADNQLQGVREFDEQELIYYAGDMREDAAACLDNIATRIDRLRGNRELREGTSIQMQELVDGFGAFRIAEKLLTI